jgi:hypothetical protein
MNRQLLRPLALVLLLAACSSSHPAPKPAAKPPPPRPAVNAPALRAYAAAIGAVSAPVDTISKELRGCVDSTAQCRADAQASATIAATLLRQLRTDDTYREAGSSAPLAPGISPLVFKTEKDAGAVKKAARSVSAHADKLAITRLAKHVTSFAADVDAWEPGGAAAKAIASVHVSIPPAAA